MNTSYKSKYFSDMSRPDSMKEAGWEDEIMALSDDEEGLDQLHANIMKSQFYTAAGELQRVHSIVNNND
jgi:hypothetical protein